MHTSDGGDEDEHEYDKSGCGHDERDKGGSEPPDGERVRGQTGQDRARSAKAGEEVAESEEREPNLRAVSSHGCLLADEGTDRTFDRTEGGREHVELNQTEIEQKATHD